jgi:hypothetical protein
MAEFDTGGFSAVNDFFEDGSAEGSSKQVSKKPTSQQPPKSKRRGGVGSLAAPKTGHLGLAKQILNVGKKRSRGDDNDDDEVEGQDPVQVDPDEEEDAGRTGIAPKEKKRAAPIGVVEDDSHNLQSEKRKLGKKERQRLKEEQAKAAELEAVADTEDTNEETLVDEADESSTNKQKKKSKRRKVRSRQKNIYKDKREEKPSYLVPGRSYYEGRPMTAETRSKLNLPEPKARPLFVVDREPGTTDDDGGQLGVDDLLEDTGKELEMKAPSKATIKAQKAKKKKYKNLR